MLLFQLKLEAFEGEQASPAMGAGLTLTAPNKQHFSQRPHQTRLPVNTVDQDNKTTP